jgi:hypothetical protein
MALVHEVTYEAGIMQNNTPRYWHLQIKVPRLLPIVEIHEFLSLLVHACNYN